MHLRMPEIAVLMPIFLGEGENICLVGKWILLFLRDRIICSVPQMPAVC